LHGVRDVTFDEDRSQIRKKNGAKVMASLRNLVISISRLLGFRYVPERIRCFMMHIEDALRVVESKLIIQNSFYLMIQG